MSTVDKVIVSENIKRIRYRLGLTQEGFSSLLGIKRSALGAYEEARCLPRHEVLKAMAGLVNLAQEDILFKPLYRDVVRPERVQLTRDTAQFSGDIKVYSLSDEKGDVFYIGCTINSVATRMRQHVCSAKKKRKPSKTGDKIRALNYRVCATVVAIATVENITVSDALIKARVMEREYMDKYEALGYTLTNSFIRTIRKVDRPMEAVGDTISSF